MINEWDITQINQAKLKEQMPKVAVLGASAIEAHNYHLPEGQDFLHTDAIVKRVSQMAWEKTKSVFCLPTIPYGLDCNLIDFPLLKKMSPLVLSDDLLFRDEKANRHLKQGGYFHVCGKFFRRGLIWIKFTK